MILTKLPIEIFQDIGSYLTFKEKAVCQQVCSQWYVRWIQFVYDDIHTKGKEQFHHFYKNNLCSSLYTTPYRSVGHQIRRLVIENGQVEPSLLGQLPILCPNLQVFMLDGIVLSERARRKSIQYYQQKEHMVEINEIQQNIGHWCHMRHIVELNGIHITHALLSSQNAYQLTHISVQFNNPNDQTNNKPAFIDLLVNAPLLDSLSVERVYLVKEELEKIHTHCPKLTSLHLINTVLLPITQDSQNCVMPANALNELIIMDASFCDNVSQWLHYISQKYIQARIVHIENCSLTLQEGSLSDVLHYQTQLLHIAKQFTRIKSLKLLSFALGPSFFDILDAKGICLSELALGDGRHTIHLASELNALLNSRQKDYVARLTLHGWPLSSTSQGSWMLMSALTHCINLTHVHLTMGRQIQNGSTRVSNDPSNHNTLYLDIILESCPKLISLRVTDAKLVTTTDHHNHTHNTTSFLLKVFTLENVLFESASICNLLSLKCPLLTCLSLSLTVPYPEQLDTRHLHISLPHHRLQSLILDRIRVSHKCSIRLGNSRFRITHSKQTTWYDLVGYECIYSHFSPKQNAMCEKMRAKKVKITKGIASNLDQSVHVAVHCKDIESITLTGFNVTL